MNSKLQVKTLLLHEAKTYKWLAEQLTKRTGRKYSASSFSNRLNASSIRYDEVLAIADILGYDITFSKRK